MVAKTKSISRLACTWFAVTGLTLLGCRANERASLFHRLHPDPAEATAGLRRIEIIEPFTRVRDFDQDGALDGIELLMQAVNRQGGDGMQIEGNLSVELYDFVEASAMRKGKRIDRWAVDLSSEEVQQKHWNSLTGLYEFRLEVNAEILPKKRKFVLAVTYNNRENVHFMDDSILEYDVRGYSPIAISHDAG